MNTTPPSGDEAIHALVQFHAVSPPLGYPEPEENLRSPVAVVSDPPSAIGYLIGALLPDAAHLQLNQMPEAGDFRMIIFHTDLTDSSNHPRWRSSFSWKAASAGAVIWNACATNVSKRRIHRAVNAMGLPSLQPAGEMAPDTLVIVKSDQNCGGLAESRISGTGVRTSRVHQITGTKNYIVCELGHVDADLKQHAQVVIDRYVENARGIFFRAYRAGVRLVVCQSESKNLIKQMGFGKPRTSTFFRNQNDNPDCETVVLEAARQAYLITSELGLHFGTLDLVMDDANVLYVCDVNATPFWEESEAEIELFLRDGIMAGLV